MSIITRFMTNDLIQAFGWTILHSLWQGIAIALLLAGALLALRRSGPQVRYWAGLAAMGLVIMTAVITFLTIYEPAASVAIADTEAVSVAEAAPVVMEGTPVAFEWRWESTLAYFSQHLPLLVLFWLLGVLVLTLRMAGELIYLQHLRYNRSKPAATGWQQQLQELAGRMNLSMDIRLRESRRIHSPMVIGFIKPVVLVPVGLLINLPPDQVESALAHELAHIRRHDYLINLLQSMVETLFFFNPALWWISGQVRTEREHCCDDWAVALTGDEVAFVKTLATLEEYRVRHSGLVVGLAGSRGSVLGRIQRLLEERQSRHLPFRVFWSALILLLFLGLAAFTWHPENGGQQSFSPSGKTRIEITRLDTMPPSILNSDPEKTEASILAESEAQIPEVSSGSSAEEALAVRTTPAMETSEEAMVDTIPESEASRQKKLLQLEREIREQQLKIENQRLQLKEKSRQLEQEVQLAQNVRETKMLELKEKEQRLRNEIELKQEELQIKESELRNQVNEVEAEIQELEMEVREEESKESPDRQRIQGLETQWKKLQKRKLELQKQANQTQLNQRKAAFEIQKQLRELQEMQLVLERESQIQQHEQQLLIMKLQQEYQKLETEKQLLQNEYQLKMLKLQEESVN